MGPVSQTKNKLNLRLQLNVQEEEELVSHKLPGQKHKPKNPHSLSKAVSANRAAEKKH